MKKYNSQDIKDAFINLGIKPGDVILLHSSLVHLGKSEGQRPENFPHAIISLLLEILEGKGTLVAPTFNFDFCHGKPFDLQRTPSQKMGALSEAIRTWPSAYRSRHPMQSVSAIGRYAKEICRPNTASAFSIDGPFDLMLAKNAKLVLLGAPFQAASLIHYTEERLTVPYRHWKEFTGICIDKQQETRTYQLYVRDRELNPQLDLKILDNKMTALGLTQSQQVGMGKIKVCTFANFYQVSANLLKKDPFALLKNREEVIEKIGEDKNNGNNL